MQGCGEQPVTWGEGVGVVCGCLPPVQFPPMRCLPIRLHTHEAQSSGKAQVPWVCGGGVRVCGEQPVTWVEGVCMVCVCLPPVHCPPTCCLPMGLHTHGARGSGKALEQQGRVEGVCKGGWSSQSPGVMVWVWCVCASHLVHCPPMCCLPMGLHTHGAQGIGKAQVAPWHGLGRASSLRFWAKFGEVRRI